MEVSIRQLKSHLSEYLNKLQPGEEITVTSHGRAVARLLPPRGKPKRGNPEKEAIAFLRSQPWIRAGKGGKPRVPKPVLRLKRGEKTAAEIVSEQRG